MKKTLLTVLCALALTSAKAYDYNYLTFEKADGTLTSLDVSSLKLTISGGSLVAVNASTSETFTLTDLSKMYFATTSGISDLKAGGDTNVKVYTLTGIAVGTFDTLEVAQSRLPKGVYVISTQGKTSKVTVK